MRFNHVAQRPNAEGFSHNIGRGFLAHEQYFGFGCELANSSSGFDSIQGWKPDVQHDQIGVQFLCFLNRLQSIRYFANDLKVGSFVKNGGDKLPEGREILYHEYSK